MPIVPKIIVSTLWLHWIPPKESTHANKEIVLSNLVVYFAKWAETEQF
jgi:hypothetical protein